MRRFLFVVLLLLGLSAGAQQLVIYDARDLFPKDAWNPPCKAVFTEDYYYSEEWLSLLCAPRTLRSRICANTILYFGKLF